MKQSLLQLERHFITTVQQYGDNAKQSILASVNLLKALLKENKPHLLGRAMAIVKQLPRNTELTEYKFSVYLQQVQLMEKEKQYEQAYNLLLELLPLEQDQSTKMLQIQILFHLMENGRQLKLFEYSNQLIQAMDEVQLDIANFRAFERKYQLILVRTYYLQAKFLERKEEDNEAIQFYFEAYKLGEEILGPNDGMTIKSKEKYESLCDKLSVCLQIEEEIPEVEHQKQTRGKNYNVMVNQIYIKQTRKEEKKSVRNVKAVESRKKSIYEDMKRNQSQHFTIKKNSRPTSAITSTTKFPSPRNQGLSMFSMFSNKREQKKENGYDKYRNVELVLKKDVMDLMNPRPVTASQIRVNDCSVIVLKVPSKNPQILMKSSSNLGLMRKSSVLPQVVPSFSQIHRGSYKRLPPKENEKISGSYRNVTIKSETNIENEVEEEESKSKQSSAQRLSVGSKNNQSLDPIILKFLQNHTMDELNDAVEIIVSGLRRLTAPKIDELQQNSIFNNNNNNNNTNNNTIRKHSPNKMMARQSTIFMQPSVGFVSIMQKKIMENEHTKDILNFFSTSFILESHPIQFYHKLFTDPEQYLWVLENPNFRVQCPQKYLQSEYTEDLNEIEYIKKILSSPKSTHALQLVGSIQIANYFRKIQLRFTINQFIEHYEDIGDYENFNDMFDQVLTIYLKQEGLLIQWTEQYKERQIITPQNGQYSQYMLSKILFLLQHKVYVKSINGYKFKTEGPTIQYDILNKNNQIYQQRKKYIRQSITSIQQFQRQSQVEKAHIQRKRRRRTRLANNPLPQLLSPLISSEDDQSNQHSSSNLRSPGLNNQEMSIRLNLPPDSSTLIPRMIPTRRKLYQKQTIQVQDYEDEDQYTAEQMQDYINYYFPEFKIGPFTEYVPSYVPLKRRPRRLLIDTPYFPKQSTEKIKFQPYLCIFPKSYLLLAKIFKIDKQFFFVRLSDKLYVQQVSLKNTWKDEFEVSLDDLIQYKIGRTGYLFNILDLEEQIYKCLQIQNCKIKLTLPIHNIPISEQQQKEQSYQQTLESRNYETDLLFLLGFNQFVYVGQQEICSERILIKEDKAFLVKKQQRKKLKKQIRITLSYEEINKHISRTNERTVNQQNDIQLFHSYNSVAMLKNKTVYGNIKLIIKSHQIQKQFKDQNLQGKLSIYGKKYYTTELSFQQLEQFAHLLCNDTGMKRYLLNYKLIMRRTLIGKQLIQNNYQKSQSKEIRYLLLQNNIKSDEHYQYCNIKIGANRCSNKQIGKVFITYKQTGPLIMMTIMNEKDRTKAHKFLSYSKMANNLILRSTHTYNRLEQIQITQNSERKKYFLSNCYLDERILVGQQVHNRIVFKKAICISKQYFLVTVVLIQDFFQIYLYNQQNCRRFYFRLHKSDMNQMDQEFLDSIFPVQNMEIVEQLFRPWKLQEINKIYHVVQKAPELFKTRTSRIISQLKQKNPQRFNTQPIRKLQKSLTQNFDTPPAFMKSSSLVMPDYDDPPTQRQDCWLHSILIKKHESVFEKKLWDVLLTYLKIEDNIVKLNTYSCELSELLFSHDRNCNFLCYMPCKEIHQSFRWQPTRLRLYSYLNYKTLDAPLDFRGKQTQMAKQCQTVLKQYLKEIQSKKQISCIPGSQEYMNINKFNDVSEVGYQLLYKGVFTITQKLMIGVFYYKGIYLVRIYKLNNYVTKKYTIQQIELRIPYIQQLLRNDPLEAGRRISITYRNNLIHAAFLKF